MADAPQASSAPAGDAPSADAPAGAPTSGASAGAPTGDIPSVGAPAEVRSAEEIRARAVQLASSMTPADLQGFKDLQNMMLALGLPAVRLLFKHLLKASKLAGADKAKVKKAIADFLPITETISARADFYDTQTKKANTAYILLGECSKTHNLDAQLDKLQKRVAQDKWPEILRHISVIVSTALQIYKQVAAGHQDLLKQLAGDRWQEFLMAKVDRQNTTLCLDPEWPRRVGIFVKLEAEINTGGVDQLPGKSTK